MKYLISCQKDRVAAVVLIISLLSACGGSGSNTSSSVNTPPPATSPETPVDNEQPQETTLVPVAEEENGTLIPQLPEEFHSSSGENTQTAAESNPSASFASSANYDTEKSIATSTTSVTVSENYIASTSLSLLRSIN